MPTEINYRANIHGLKQLGVERILSLSAVGSLKEEHHPLDFVIPDQFVDRTRHRVDTFFGDGLVAHIGFGDPICDEAAEIAAQACRNAGVNVKPGGTYLNMEGPQFSTKAESNLYRSWGLDVIGMTNLTEARLAREAELCYVTVAMVTDYDCWHRGARLSYRRSDRRRAAEERGACLQRGAGGGCCHAENARLQMRFGAEERHHHAERRCAGGHAGAACGCWSANISIPNRKREHSTCPFLWLVRSHSIP